MTVLSLCCANADEPNMSSPHAYIPWLSLVLLPSWLFHVSVPDRHIILQVDLATMEPASRFLFCPRPSNNVSKDNHHKKKQGFLSLTGPLKSLENGKEGSRSSKDGSGLPKPPPPPRILQNYWGCAGRFCEMFHIVTSLLKKSSAEPQEVLQNFGSQAQLFRPCN